MNKQQLSKIIQRRTGLKEEEIKKFFHLLENSFLEALRANQKIKLSRFGTFSVVTTKSRTVVNPRNPRQKMLTLGKRVIKFKPAETLKKEIAPLKKPKESLEKFLQLRIKPVRIPFLDLTKKTIDKEILTKIPEAIARSYQIVPVEERDGRLVVAMINPEDFQAIEFVKKKTGMDLIVGITTLASLNHVLDQYAGIAAEVEKALGEEAEEIEEAITIKKEEKKPKEIEMMGLDAPTVRVVNTILKKAVKEKASDIHIEPTEKELVTRFRVDGVLHKAITLPLAIHPSIIARIKILTNLKIDETRIPQDGRFSMVMDKNEIDFRVSTMPTAYGEKVAMRVLDKSAARLTLDQLGCRGHAFSVLDENIHKSRGMVLITGPTGCGKTTTLYAIIDRIYDVGINITTLEDPIEYRIPGINQSQINPEVGFTFASGLRALVRQDPDVIMVGEIRDFETAEMAVHAALTGHVVLSTLHTNDAAGAVPRLVDMKVEPFLIVSSLNLVVAQRLCRKICETCKEETTLEPGVLSEIENEIKNMPVNEQKEVAKKRPFKFYKGKGCPDCNNTGYKGRIGIFEVLPMTEKIKDLIVKRVGASILEKEAIKEGMVTMKQDGILKVLDGITTIEEVWRVTKE